MDADVPIAEDDLLHCWPDRCPPASGLVRESGAETAGMLRDRHARHTLDDLLSPPGTWQPFPPAADRGAWVDLQRPALRQRQAAWLIGRAEGITDLPWPALPARLLRRFAADGDRVTFEQAYFRRRNRLARLVLAECCEGHGRFLDEIVDGLYLLCEETSWCLPAHYSHLPGGRVTPLPPGEREVVDLFAAETAMTVAEAVALLRDELDAITPTIRARVASEVERRVLRPVLEHDDWWWLAGRNNWTPWIASNLLGAGAYLLEDAAADRELCWRMMGALDRFLAGYGEDGGCDEGAMYWGYAGGALLMALEVLHSRSEGRIDVFAETKVANIAHYPVACHLGWRHFLTFADAKPPVRIPVEVMWRFGQRVGDRALQNLAQLAMRGFDPLGPVDPPLAHDFKGGDLARMLRQLWWIDPGAEAVPPSKELDRWLPSIQVMVAHESEEDSVDLVLAAKAGHNDENHNHNDIGQFIIMLDGVPALIDVGVGEYSLRSFSQQRYDDWVLSAVGHAVPCINGHRQIAGRACAAREVEHQADGRSAVLSLDAAPCYAAEAGVERAHRRLALVRAEPGHIALDDEVVVAHGPVTVELPLLTARTVREVGPGRLVVECGEDDLEIAYDEGVLVHEIQAVPLEDRILAAAWGERLTRIVLRGRSQGSRLAYGLRFRAIPGQG